MSIERGRPQCDIRWPVIVDFVSRDDLVLRFLDRHELAEFRWLRNFALPNGLSMGLEHAQYFVSHVGIAPEQSRPRGSPSAVLAHCIVRVNTRIPSCISELSVG